MTIEQHSNWGDLDPEAIERIKSNVRRAVADGIDDAMRQGAMRDAIAEGVTLGVQTVAMDDDLFELLGSRAAQSLRKTLVKNTGSLVLGGAVQMLRGVMWACIGFIVIFSLFGWSGIATTWKYFTTGPHP